MNNIKHSTKKPVLYLHIGSPKTGTSALQMCLSKNRKLLMENKICYSNFHETINFHLNLTLGLVGEYFKENGIQNGVPIGMPEDLYEQDPRDIVKGIKNTVYESNSSIAIISDECLFESTIWWIYPLSVNTKNLIRGRRNYVIKYFKEAFKEFDIKIVCYLRRQDDYIESLYNQFCKGINPEIYNVIFENPESVSLGRNKYMSDEENSPDPLMTKMINGFIDVGYYTNLSQWAEIYGKENIIVRPYEKSQMPKGVEYDFFINVLGFNDDFMARLEIFNDINASFSKDLIEYRMNARLFDILAEFIALNDSLADSHYLKTNNKKNILTAKEANRILDYYEEDNKKIAREYLRRENGAFFYKKRREAEDDYPGLSLQAALDISREIIVLLTNKHQSEKTTVDANVVSFQAGLDIANKQILLLQDELDRANSRSHSLQAQIESTNEKNLSLRTEIENANDKNLSLETNLSSLHQSTSWKITKPLRATKRALEKFFRRP
jgi:hypothetical protein